MAIHLPTMLLMIITASGTLALSVGWVARSKDKEGLYTWTAALSLQTLGFVLLSLRYQIPDFFSILVANTALSASRSLFIAAIAQFQQRRIPSVLFWGPPLVLAFTFSWLMHDFAARVVVSGVINIFQVLMALIILMSREYAITGRGKHLMVCGLGIMVATLTVRTLSMVMLPDTTLSMMEQNPVQALAFLVAFGSLILVSNGFVLMSKERADEHIRLIAMKDRLTGTWNRIRLEEAALMEMARLDRYGHPVSLIMADIDHFKEINDHFGHATGDQILKEFCAVTQSCIRTTDLLGRWGGEEFLVLLPNSGFSSTARIAERIRSTLEQYELAEGLRITASFGFAVCQSTDTWDSWLDRADKALYRAKSAGRNRVETESLQPDANTADHPDTHLVPLVWRKAYASDNGHIDTQHRALFENVNTPLNSIKDNRPKQELAQLIGALVAEIRQHFEEEEQLFRAAEYPDSERHCELHHHLVTRGIQLTERFEKGQVGAGELFHYLAYEVVAQHMLIEDRKFFSLPATLSI